MYTYLFEPQEKSPTVIGEVLKQKANELFFSANI